MVVGVVFIKGKKKKLCKNSNRTTTLNVYIEVLLFVWNNRFLVRWLQNLLKSWEPPPSASLTWTGPWTFCHVRLSDDSLTRLNLKLHVVGHSPYEKALTGFSLGILVCPHLTHFFVDTNNLFFIYIQLTYGRLYWRENLKTTSTPALQM